MEKYFMHRIQVENGNISKGIEVHDTRDDAIRSFWGRMKLGYNNPSNPDLTFISCKVTGPDGKVVDDYDMTWLKDENIQNTYFMHHIRKDGDAFTKDITICDSMDVALRAFATELEYGYNNQRFPNVDFVSCMITDQLSGGMILKAETWAKPAAEPAPEPEPAV